MGLVKPISPVLQRGHPLAPGLSLAYPFSEGSGTKLNDLSGNNFTGNINAPAWVGGPFGSALSFNGTTQYVDIPDSVAGLSSNASPFTISALAHPATTSAGAHNIFTSGSAAGVGFRVQMRRDGADWNIYVGDTLTSFVNATQVGGVTAGQWQLVTGSWDGSTLKLYINGAFINQVACASSVRAGSNNTIGVDSTDYAPGAQSQFWDGDIDGVLVYNRALSATEVAQLYFDPFAIYRSRTRFAQFVSTAAPPAACAPTLSLLGVGCGIQAARAVIRNRVVGRREIVAELLGVNDD